MMWLRRNRLRVALLVLLLGISGCVQSGPVGKWVRDPEVTALFEKGTLLKDHTYYYRGGETEPDSIIAIDNRYTLKTKVWSKVDINQKILDDWIYWLTIRPRITCPYHGGYILTPDGDRAGVWYSRKQFTTIRLVEPGVLQVYPPYNISGSNCARAERLDDL